MPSGWFVEAYQGTPPWDIGRPQPVFERLADANEIVGPVLDVGCGTGENALYLAERGFDVLGVDGVEAAVAAARSKARERGLEASFEVLDALALPQLGRVFVSVIDSGLFHVFEDDERPLYVASLAAALAADGRYFMLCFSEHEPGSGGPRRVTQQEIRATFRPPLFAVQSVEAAEMATLLADEPKHAWFARIRRLAGS